MIYKIIKYILTFYGTTTVTFIIFLFFIKIKKLDETGGTAYLFISIFIGVLITIISIFYEFLIKN